MNSRRFMIGRILSSTRNDFLGFVLDSLQVLFAEETFGVDFVDLFSAGRARGEPAIRGHNLDAADRSAVAGRGGEDMLDGLAGELVGVDICGGQTGQLCFLLAGGG